MTSREMTAYIRRLNREGFVATVTGGSHWRITLRLSGSRFRIGNTQAGQRDMSYVAVNLGWPQAGYGRAGLETFAGAETNVSDCVIPCSMELTTAHS